MLGLKRSTAKNLMAMFAWQGMNYVLPLLTLPYLARVLKPAEFGLLGFAASIIAYAMLFTDWGFGLSATQQIAVNRNNTEAITSIFWSTIFAKILLAAISLVALLILISVVPVLHDHMWLLLAVWLQVPGSVMTTSWYLQGMELLTRFATASIVSRGIPIPLMFILVHSPRDVAIAALLQSSGSIIAGIISLRMAFATGKIKSVMFCWPTVCAALRSSTTLFFATVSYSVYSNMNTLVLAGVSGPVQVGLFVGAEKLRQAVQGLVVPIVAVMYPRIAGMAAEDGRATLNLIKKLLLIQGSFGAVLSIGTWVAAPWAVPILLGSGYMGAVNVLRALALVPFLVCINNVLVMQFMLPFGYRTEALFVIAVSGAVSLLYMPLLAYNFGAVGVGVALCITETIVNVVAAAVIYVRRHHIRMLVYTTQAAK